MPWVVRDESVSGLRVCYRISSAEHSSTEDCSDHWIYNIVGMEFFVRAIRRNRVAKRQVVASKGTNGKVEWEIKLENNYSKKFCCQRREN